MPRNARLKLDDGGFYHLCARAAAKNGEFPLDSPVVKLKLLNSRVFNDFRRRWIDHMTSSPRTEP